MAKKIWLGKCGDEKVYWFPEEERNPHALLVGGSGSGKTETLKAVCL